MTEMTRRILSLSGRYKKRIFFGLAFNILKAFSMSFMFIGVFYIFMNLQNLNIEIIKTGFLIVLLSVIARFIFQWLVDIFVTAAGFDIFMDYRLGVGDRLKRAPMGYFSETNLGQIQGVLTTTIGSLENYTMMAITNLTVGFTMAIFMIVLLLYFCFPVGIISLCGMLLALTILSQVNIRANKSTKKLGKAQENLIIKTIEYVRGISVLRSFKKSIQGQKRVVSAFEEKSRADYDQERSMAGILKAYQYTFKLTSCLMVLLVAYLYIHGNMTKDYAIIYMMSSFFIYSELETLGDAAFLSQRINNQLNRVEEITNIPSIDESNKTLDVNDNSIVFNNVSFAYEKENVLKNININIPQKKSTAIIGPSGSGKTTLCQLIGRFWDNIEGEIAIGGQNIKDVSYDSLMRNISMVFQNVYLFNDTVENNIKFGRPDASYEEIREVAKKACCDEFIMKLPNGYQTIIGEGGSTLSGGEKQRISIARAILKDAPIIIFDEATSSVDTENESYLLNAIKELTKAKTVITIAHRISTIRNADQIIVIDKGEVVQKGNHSKLLEEEGIYKRFLQAINKSDNWKIEKEVI
jgi:ATP-binding cassette subfamily B protein